MKCHFYASALITAAPIVGVRVIIAYGTSSLRRTSGLCHIIALKGCFKGRTECLRPAGDDFGRAPARAGCSVEPGAAPWQGQPRAHTGNCLLSFNLCSSVPAPPQTQPVLAVRADLPSGEAGREQTESWGMLGTQETPSQHCWGVRGQCEIPPFPNTILNCKNCFFLTEIHKQPLVAEGGRLFWGRQDTSITRWLFQGPTAHPRHRWLIPSPSPSLSLYPQKIP